MRHFVILNKKGEVVEYQKGTTDLSKIPGRKEVEVTDPDDIKMLGKKKAKLKKTKVKKHE